MSTSAETQKYECERFFNDYLDLAELAWPRLVRKDGGLAARRRLLVRGNLTLDLPVKLTASLVSFMAALKEGHEKFRCEWEMAGLPVVGGFVGQVAPLADGLGLDVHLNCAVGVPTPAPLREFIESGKYDTRHTVAYPAPAPASVELRFNDGHVLLPRLGVDGLVAAPVPSGMGAGYDVVLVNPGRCQSRGALLGRLAAEFRPGCRATLGVVGRGDWTADELLQLKDTQSWLFLNRVEAVEIATRVRGGSAVGDPEEAAMVLKALLGTVTKLVVSLGKDGAYLLNGSKRPHRFSTTPFEGNSTGCGDMLTLFATAASALGKSDDEATALGVEAATRRAAGHPLPSIDVR
jgi:hypothetical protein